MNKHRRFVMLLVVICIMSTALVLYLLGKLNHAHIEDWLQQSGRWAPLIYILAYTIATILILPSTALNLMGGALFGAVGGTIWTSIAALTAAIVSFGFSRTIGRDLVSQTFLHSWQAIDAEIKQGGTFYMFAIRLLPIIPYGVVNYASGLTSISFREYITGTTLGTVPGILPFVLIGSSGSQAIQTGDILPLIGALTLAGILVGFATWYRRQRQPPKTSDNAFNPKSK